MFDKTLVESFHREMTEYLSLVDYAAKYRISLSTLRRRIKNKEVQFKVDKGRYLIIDDQDVVPQFRFSPSQLISSKALRGALDMIKQKENTIEQLRTELATLESLVQLLEQKIQTSENSRELTL